MEEPSKEMRATKRILVVEDHEYSARIYCDFMRVCGYEYERVLNGIEAVAAVERDCFNLVLMDVMMPEMNGYDATLEIVETMPADRLPCIIGVTGNSLKKDLERCREVGMSKVLIKPVDFENLRLVLDQALFAEEKFSADEAFSHEVKRIHRSGHGSSAVDESVATAFVERMSTASSPEINPMDAFSDSVDECLGKLDLAIADGDREQIESCAHILKSVAALVGARDLEDLSRGLEVAAVKGGPHFRPMHWFILIKDAVNVLRRILMRSSGS